MFPRPYSSEYMTIKLRVHEVEGDLYRLGETPDARGATGFYYTANYLLTFLSRVFVSRTDPGPRELTVSTVPLAGAQCVLTRSTVFSTGWYYRVRLLKEPPESLLYPPDQVSLCAHGLAMLGGPQRSIWVRMEDLP